jgi:hypothetical protein
MTWTLGSFRPGLAFRFFCSFATRRLFQKFARAGIAKHLGDKFGDAANNPSAVTNLFY